MLSLHQGFYSQEIKWLPGLGSNQRLDFYKQRLN